MSALRLCWLVALAALAGCGGGGSGDAPAAPAATPPAANVLPITVDRGTDGRAFNSPFVSVTICMPGAAACQTVDHVLVDTGSFGFRLAASVLDPTLALPAVASDAGLPVAECAHFATGFAWGSVRRADLKLAGETAPSLPIQIVGDTASPYAMVPPSCSNTGANFGAAMGVNGILGVGLFNQDCPACSVSAAPASYFACSGSGCSSVALPLASQVANPVAAFPVDNNGVVMVLPAVAPGGASTLAGSLIFGIGTQANNQLGTATVYATNGRGDFTTRYKGVDYRESFIDSGSNGIFFNDPGIAQCAGFYCPPAALALSAVNISSTGVSTTVDFTVENIQSLSRNVVAANVGGDIGMADIFDWGLPFFFGRSVFVAFSGAATPKGNGPYWAY